MKLSVRGEYALRALQVLAMNHGAGVVSVQAIADGQNIPKRFLEQILNDLRSAGIVESRRGVAGGYRLKQSPSEVSLSAVIRHVDGALAPISCVSEQFYEPCTCPDESKCALRSIMGEVRTAIVGILENLTLADLVRRASELGQSKESGGDYAI